MDWATFIMALLKMLQEWQELTGFANPSSLGADMKRLI